MESRKTVLLNPLQGRNRNAVIKMDMWTRGGRGRVPTEKVAQTYIHYHV